MRAALAPWALLLANFVTGLAVLAPAGMLNELAADFGISVQKAGLLVTFGAVVLCIGSPIIAWATTGIDRRLLLAGTLALVALGHAASAFATSYAVLMTLRLMTLAAAAIITPQAAATISLMVSEKDRAGAISFVFLGWSLSIAIGLPLVQFTADQFGWRETYGILAAMLILVFVMAAASIPTGLRGTALSLKSWIDIARNRMILLLLVITAVWVSGGFLLFPYLAPLYAKLGGASPQMIAGFFALSGIMGFIGNVVASRIVGTIGAFQTAVIFLVSVLVGAVIWSFGAGSLAIMGTATALLGFGTLALNSMQQARLVAVAPALASGTVALNTSSLYVGQAVGSALGGALIGHDLATAMGPVAAVILIAGLVLLLLSRRTG